MAPSLRSGTLRAIAMAASRSGASIR
jgi:hypothetical protein